MVVAPAAPVKASILVGISRRVRECPARRTVRPGIHRDDRRPGVTGGEQKTGSEKDANRFRGCLQTERTARTQVCEQHGVDHLRVSKFWEAHLPSPRLPHHGCKSRTVHALAPFFFVMLSESHANYGLLIDLPGNGRARPHRTGGANRTTSSAALERIAPVASSVWGNLPHRYRGVVGVWRTEQAGNSWRPNPVPGGIVRDDRRSPEVRGC